MKILINTPCLGLLGGVANHYLGLRDFWSVRVWYNTVGRRSQRRLSGWLWLPYDVVKFVAKLFWFRPDAVVLNPSLGKNAVKRDFLFLRLAVFFRRRVVLFFHGFNMQAGKEMDHEWLCRPINKCAGVFVLADEFRVALRSWGVKVPIEIVTTKVDDNLLAGVTVKERERVRNVLFLARITREKGIFIALEAFGRVQQRFPDLHLYVVGDGPALAEAKAQCERGEIRNVHFTGRLSGQALTQIYVRSDLYLFPTYHAEGLPTSVLEAMAFGLPVITRPVGGLNDFFENGGMGFLVDSLRPEDFAEKLIYFVEHPECVRLASQLNHSYALEHFMASRVALDFERKVRLLLESQK